MALRVPTVMIIGAGVSCELGFPSGPALLADVAKALDVRFDHVRQIAGSTSIMAAYRRHHAGASPDEDLNDYLYAGWRLRDAAILAKSIDNAIDQNDGNQKVAFCGKLAIAEAILKSERKSPIFIDPARPKPCVDRARDTWLHHLAQILTTDIRKSSIESVADNLAIISFNYDRSVRHYIPHALVQAYGVDRQTAEDVARGLQIFHPYGQVGALPWVADSDGLIDYGGEPGHMLEHAAAGIQTFGESRAETEELAKMRALLANARQVAFLGFGFHRPNMDLLFPRTGLQTERVFATVYKEPAPAQEAARNALARIFDHPRAQISLVDSSGSDFLREHYSALTA